MPASHSSSRCPMMTSKSLHAQRFQRRLSAPRKKAFEAITPRNGHKWVNDEDSEDALKSARAHARGNSSFSIWPCLSRASISSHEPHPEPQGGKTLVEINPSLRLIKIENKTRHQYGGTKLWQSALTPPRPAQTIAATQKAFPCSFKVPTL